VKIFSTSLSFLSLSLFALTFAITSTTAAAPLHVMIDPGHGGTDSGAVSNHLRESEIALKVGLLLKSKLAADPRFQVSMTRTTDKNVGLDERVKLAEQAKVDVFLSIHLNANTDIHARGVELYFQNHLPPDEETLFLAASENQAVKSRIPATAEETAETADEEAPTKKNDVTAILEDLERHHRMLASHRLSVELLKAWNLSPKERPYSAIRQAPFRVISKGHVPSVLVELGFVTNPKEAEKLANSAYQTEVAQKIYQGLLVYKEKQDKGLAPRLSEKD
jgi:N-acetylmuramoyl-L-alanine amidase